MKTHISNSIMLALVLGSLNIGFSQTANKTALDAKVEKFLSDHKREWHDLNVPYEDGKTLHGLTRADRRAAGAA